MRDEFLNGEIFYSIKELRVLAERWRKHYNIIRPHSSLGYRPPAPETWMASNAWAPGSRSLRSLQPQRPYPASIRAWRSMRYTNNPTGTKHRSGQRPRSESRADEVAPKIAQLPCQPEILNAHYYGGGTNLVEEIQSALLHWFGSGQKERESSCTFSRRPKDAGLDVFISHFDEDFKVEVIERCLLFRVKQTRLNFDLERFLISSAFEGETLCFKINEDPARSHRLLTSVFRQISETKHPAFCTRILRAVAGLEDDLTSALIEEATAASTDQLVMLEALSSAPWVVELAAKDPILEAKLRGLQLRQDILEKFGGAMTSEGVAEVQQISRQAVDKRRARNQLLALTQSRKGYSYPSFQFEEGKTLAGLDRVLAELSA